MRLVLRPCPRTLVAFLLVSASAFPGDPDADWSTAFDVPGLGGRVFALGQWGGSLVAGGHVFPTDGEFVQHVAGFDGASWQPFLGGVGGDVRAIVEYQGDLVVAGGFSTADGAPANGIARFDGAQWHALGAGLELSFALQPDVFALAVFQGDLYAGGTFDRAGGQPVSNLARWDGAQWHPVLGGVQGEVLSFTTDATKLYVGGSFLTVGGSVAASCVAAFDGVAWSPLGAGLGDAVRALQVFQGSLYAGGSFTHSGGQPRAKVAVFSGGAWQALGSGVPDTSISTSVYALEVHGGSLYMGGNFSSVSGVAATKVARFDGAQWHGFGGVAGSGALTTVFALESHAGKLVVGGEFLRAGADPFVGPGVASEHVASWDGAGWDAVGEGLGTDGPVLALGRWNGGVVAAGKFTAAGTTLVDDLAWFDGNGWTSIGELAGSVKDLTEYQGNLVVVGDFTSVDGVPANRIARFDGQQWSSFGAGFTASQSPTVVEVHQGQLHVGGVGPVRRWNGAAWETFGTPIFGQILAMRSYLGKLYVGGSFGAFSGPGPNLAVWDGVATTSLGADGIVNTFEVFQGELIAGGEFSHAAGVTAARLVHFDGAQWMPSPVPADGVSILDLEVADDVLFVAGNPAFYESGLPRYLGRFDGQSLETLGSDLLGAPLALFGDSVTGTLWIGGSFFEAGGAPAANVTTWDVRHAWEDVGFGLSGTHGVPALVGTGTLAPQSPLFLQLSNAKQNSTFALIVGATRVDLPFFGGTLVPSPDVLLFGLPTGPTGAITIGTTSPPGLPSGFVFHLQAWVADPVGPAGYAASNGLSATAP